MKGRFLSIGLLAATLSSGQQKETVKVDELIRYRFDTSMKKQWTSGIFHKQLQRATHPENKELTGQLSYMLPDGDQVYRLPTDQMPCIKPGHQQVYTMPVLPNPKEQLQPGKTGNIPNPAL
jgi:hypothetical protein